jgi:hypothetical protein
MSGLGASFGSQPGVPGFVDQFSQGMLGQAAGQSINAMNNRYAQLGLSGNPTGSPQQAGRTGTSQQAGGQLSTANAMDIGQLPSLVGGIPAMAEATLGQLQNAALNQPSSSGGKGGGGGGLGSLASMGMMGAMK